MVALKLRRKSQFCEDCWGGLLASGIGSSRHLTGITEALIYSVLFLIPSFINELISLHLARMKLTVIKLIWRHTL